MNGPLDGENCIQTTEAKSCTRDHPYIALAYGLVVRWVQKISLSADIQYCIYVLVSKKKSALIPIPELTAVSVPDCTKTWFRSHTSWNEYGIFLIEQVPQIEPMSQFLNSPVYDSVGLKGLSVW